MALGDKLKTKDSAKKASGKKLRREKTSSAAEARKLRFDKAVIDPESEAAGKTHYTQAYLMAFHAVSDSVSPTSDRETEEDNPGIDALDAGTQAAKTVAEGGSNVFSRWRKRQAIKKEYAAAKAGNAVDTVAANSAGKAAKDVGNLLERIREYAVSHRQLLMIGGGLFLVIMLIVGSIGSCSMLLHGGTNVVIDTSYTAEDRDILAVESDYCSLEIDLLNRINNIASEYPDYDEYNITEAQIGHDPFELASLLTVLYENYTRSQVQGMLQTIFELQYKLTIEPIVETRYRTETVTDVMPVTIGYTDPETGEYHEETYYEEYTYDVEVPYDYYILNVRLDNYGISHAVSELGLTSDERFRYGILMQTHGNKPDIFGSNPYSIATQDVVHYDIPGEALTDERFRNMITEAEKYLGYPYVWGGSSPSTSFDCSGFVCWVVNHCGNGWNVGRTTAEGLRNICSIIPPGEAQPGDLIFFQGTYNTYGASHVGIYVGGGMMIHCGNPIQYSSLDNKYWQQHFYCYGRLP